MSPGADTRYTGGILPPLRPVVVSGAPPGGARGCCQGNGDICGYPVATDTLILDGPIVKMDIAIFFQTVLLPLQLSSILPQEDKSGDNGEQCYEKTEWNDLTDCYQTKRKKVSKNQYRNIID